MRILKAASVLAVASGIGFTALADNYIVDTGASTLEWKGSKVTGFHEGTVALKSGNLEVVDGELKGGSFEIDLGTIDTTDLSGGQKKKLDNHLKSNDFFSVVDFPVAQLLIKAVSAGSNQGVFDVEADLTVKGITKPVEFTAEMKEEGDSIEAVAKVVVDRSKYDVKFRSGSFFQNLGDKLIYDDFEVDVKLVLNKG